MQKDHIKAKFAERDAIMLLERTRIVNARPSIDDNEGRFQYIMSTSGKEVNSNECQ